MIVVYGKVIVAAGGDESPDGLRLSHSRAVQTADYIGATAGGTFARGNYRHELTFAVTRLHADLRRATAYILDHPRSLADSATISFETRETSGVLRRWSAEAVLARVELLEQIGITTRWGYQFILGPIQDTNPDLAT